MPHLAPGDWLNVQRPLTRESLRGAIVLVDFWDYTCVNCLRTLPYLQEWHSRYAELGLIILGIHSPEFKFAHYRPHLERAIATHQIQYPILLDNQYENWYCSQLITPFDQNHK
jgi:thiol-disulfide isomerase/thioredoxin